ncbi:hypothetical protein ABZ589_23950 [Streptomyces sp. NPDC013313]|uniref:hypothetical protein n=1 Tax=Streptomyces sp. NPDC013313 TaxID=3155603 RepID=UPI00340259C1
MCADGEHGEGERAGSRRREVISMQVPVVPPGEDFARYYEDARFVTVDNRS